ncbi:hypothetical protein P7C70_g8497, partial [Phenoliferia sp. Uapishka_3]
MLDDEVEESAESRLPLQVDSASDAGDGDAQDSDGDSPTREENNLRSEAGERDDELENVTILSTGGEAPLVPSIRDAGDGTSETSPARTPTTSLDVPARPVSASPIPSPSSSIELSEPAKVWGVLLIGFDHALGSVHFSSASLSGPLLMRATTRLQAHGRILPPTRAESQ